MSLKCYIKVLVALAAVLALSAVSAGAAQAADDAPHFTVETVKGSAEFVTDFPAEHFTGVSTGSAGGAAGKLEVPGLFNLTNPASKCTVTGNIVGSVVEQPGTSTEIKLTCTEVHVEGLPKCSVKSPGQPAGTVVSNALHGKLVWLEKEGDRTGVTLTPTAGNFVTLEVSGVGCVAPGNYPITGTIVSEVEEVTKDLTTGKLNFPNPPITTTWNNETPRKEVKDGLLVGSKAAAFTNTFDLSLASDKLWGVRLGSVQAEKKEAPRFTITETVAGASVTDFAATPFTGVSTGSTASEGEPGGAGKLEVPGLFTLTNPANNCSVKGNFVGSGVGLPGTSTSVFLTCTEVAVESLPKCKVNSPGQPAGTVVTNELDSKLAWLNKEGDARVGNTLTPTAGNFVTLEVSGLGCVVPGNYPVTGTVVCEVEADAITKHVTAGKFECPQPPITTTWSNEIPRKEVKDGLFVGAKVASYTNTFDLTLTSDKFWGVEPG